MKIKFLGQNCFLFIHQGKSILTDPFFNFQKEKSGFDMAAQKIDYVLITHAHGDHTADVAEVLEKYPEVCFIAQPEICGYYHAKNYKDLNFGGSTFIEDLRISMVPALHTSSFPDGTYGGQPCGFVLSVRDKNLYFSGDTGLTKEMELLPQIFGKIDLAILPVGGHYTLDAHTAAFAAAELIKTPTVIGCHFDTFPPITIDHQEVKTKFDQRNIRFVLPILGEEFDF